MAEVLGVASGAVTLIEVAGRTVSYCYRLRQSWKGAPSDIIYVIDEIDAFRTVVDRLYQQVKSSERDGYDLPGLAPLQLGEKGSKEDSIMKNSVLLLDSIHNLLPKVPEGDEIGTRQKLSWMKNKSDVYSKLGKLREIRDQLQFALEADSLAIQRSTHRDVRSLVVNKEDEELMNWLRAPTCARNLEAAIDRKQEGTGNWLLSSDEFQAWLKSPCLLWLYGIPGCGKSVLSSNVIQHLQQNVNQSSTLIMYFYFDFQDENQRQADHMLRSLVAQTLAIGSKAQNIVRDHLRKAQDADRSLKTDDLTMILQDALKLFSSSYVVVDGIDECHDLTDRSRLMDVIGSLKSSNANLHLLLLSRPEEDIEEWCNKHSELSISLEGKAIQDDIHLFIDSFVTSDPRMAKWPQKTREHVVTTLKVKANGMFRWVFCHLDSLRRCESDAQVKRHLEKLPSTLHETYDQILATIDASFVNEARRILTCLAFGRRAMTVSELLCVFAIDPQTQEKVDPDALPFDRGAIQRICRSLVTVVPGDAKIDGNPNLDQSVRLAHFSVEEYLLSEETRRGPLSKYGMDALEGHIVLTELCFSTLLYFDDRSSFGAEKLDEFPFLLYAANHCVYHARIARKVENKYTDDLIFSLFHENESAYINWHRVCRPLFMSRRTRFENYKDTTRSRNDFILKDEMINPLAYTAIWNLPRIAERLLEAGHPINQCYIGNHSAMVACVIHGSWEVLHVLLKHNADIEVATWTGETPLIKAIEMLDFGMIKFLLDNGANIENASSTFGTPLQYAAGLGAFYIVKELLNRGAAINRSYLHNRGGEVGLVTALQAATLFSGNLNTVKLLVEMGAQLDIYAGGEELSAEDLTQLDAKHEKPDLDLSFTRLNVKAKTEAGNYPTVLAAAAAGGKVDIIKYLVHQLAKSGKLCIIDALGREGNPPIRLNWSLQDFKAWAKADQDAYIQGLVTDASRYRTLTIVDAAREGRKDLIEWYLDVKGANVDQRDELFLQTPLIWATIGGHYDAVCLLLDRNADPNAGNRWNDCALHKAIRNAKPRIAKLLIERGADPNKRDGRDMTPLMMAERMRRPNIAEYLLSLENISPT